MGCAQSRIENEEAVARCKERRQWMKAAVAARNAFAAAHSAYAFSLRDTGAALSEFAHGEGVPPQTPPGEAEEAAPGAAAPGGAGAGRGEGGPAGPSAAGGRALPPLGAAAWGRARLPERRGGQCVRICRPPQVTRGPGKRAASERARPR